MEHKYIWYLVIVLVVGAIIVGLARQNPANAPAGSESPSASVSPSATPTPSGAVRYTPKPTTGSGAVTLSYAEALQKYAGVRIQFDARCQASPNQITVKNGTSVMFDNRSGDARTIVVGAVTYSIAGYGFRIIPMNSRTLPATVRIDCGSAQNVAQIIIQK